MVGFILGSFFGGIVVFVVMCCVQINKTSDVYGTEEYQKLLYAYKNSEEALRKTTDDYHDLIVKYYELRDERDYYKMKDGYYGKED